MRLILWLLFSLFLVRAQDGAGLDPHGGGAMDPNGGAVRRLGDEGGHLDPNGVKAQSDEGAGLCPNGGHSGRG